MGAGGGNGCRQRSGELLLIAGVAQRGEIAVARGDFDGESGSGDVIERAQWRGHQRNRKSCRALAHGIEDGAGESVAGDDVAGLGRLPRLKAVARNVGGRERGIVDAEPGAERTRMNAEIKRGAGRVSDYGALIERESSVTIADERAADAAIFQLVAQATRDGQSHILFDQ